MRSFLLVCLVGVATAQMCPFSAGPQSPCVFPACEVDSTSSLCKIYLRSYCAKPANAAEPACTSFFNTSAPVVIPPRAVVVGLQLPGLTLANLTQGGSSQQASTAAILDSVAASMNISSSNLQILAVYECPGDSRCPVARRRRLLQAAAASYIVIEVVVTTPTAAIQATVDAQFKNPALLSVLSADIATNLGVALNNPSLNITTTTTVNRHVNPCGNGMLDAGEVCDDGNTQPSDGCTPTCQVAPGYTCSAPTATSPSVCTLPPPPPPRSTATVAVVIVLVVLLAMAVAYFVRKNRKEGMDRGEQIELSRFDRHASL